MVMSLVRSSAARAALDLTVDMALETCTP